jgi:hypothetical protein
MYNTERESDSMRKSHEAISLYDTTTQSLVHDLSSCVDTLCSRCDYHMLIVTLS